MDHILEHEGQPVPDISGVSESKGGSSTAMDVDEDDDDIEALKGLGVVKGAVAGSSSEADVEAKVRQVWNSALHNWVLTVVTSDRASSVRSVARFSRIRRLRTTTRRRVAMTNSKSPRKRWDRIVL